MPNITATDMYNARRNPLSVEEFRQRPIPANYLTLYSKVLNHSVDIDTIEQMETNVLFEQQKETINQFNEVAYFWGRWLFW